MENLSDEERADLNEDEKEYTWIVETLRKAAKKLRESTLAKIVAVGVILSCSATEVTDFTQEQCDRITGTIICATQFDQARDEANRYIVLADKTENLQECAMYLKQAIVLYDTASKYATELGEYDIFRKEFRLTESALEKRDEAIKILKKVISQIQKDERRIDSV